MKIKIIAIAFLTFALLQCAASSDSSLSQKSNNGGNSDYNYKQDTVLSSDVGYPYASKDMSSADISHEYYEENEEDFSFNSAAIGKNYIYIVDTNRNALIRVNSKDLKIDSLEVGSSPISVSTFSGEDVAVVLNSGSNTVTLIKNDKKDGKTFNFDVITNANTVKLSPYGRYGAIFYKVTSGNEISGELQAINILDARDGKEKVIKLGVGFRPMDVAFSEDGKWLFVITEDGLTKVSLPNDVESPKFKPPIAFTADSMLKAYGLEVYVTKSGKYAVTRIKGIDKFTILEIDTETLTTVDLQGMKPTDIDIVDGDDPKIVLTFRDNNRIDLIKIDSFLKQEKCIDAFDHDTCVTDCKQDCIGDTTCKQDCEKDTECKIACKGETECKQNCTEGDDNCISLCETDCINECDNSCKTNCETECTNQCDANCIQKAGESCAEPEAVTTIDTGEKSVSLCRVSGNGTTAIFYSTDTDKKYIAKLDLAEPENGLEYILVRKAVRGVEIDNQAKYAIIFHVKKPGSVLSTDDVETQLEKTYGYSVMDLASSFVAHYQTPSDPGSMIFLSDIQKMFVLIPDPKDINHYIDMFDFSTFQNTRFSLQARPLSLQRLGISSNIIVLEQHISGRLTIFDATTGSQKSITGFQLNGEIE